MKVTRPILDRLFTAYDEVVEADNHALRHAVIYRHFVANFPPLEVAPVGRSGVVLEGDALGRQGDLLSQAGPMITVVAIPVFVGDPSRARSTPATRLPCNVNVVVELSD